jgi:pimeloyl-ACP methyl ester carboxylesterase
MRTSIRIALLIVLVLSSSLLVAPVLAADPPPALPGCENGKFANTGALWAICIPPAGWNGDLLVYAHGYTAFNEEIGFQNLKMPDGTYLPALVTGLGYAFATTSYRENGLAVLNGVADIRQVTDYFPKAAGRRPGHTYLVGVSEGGLVTTLAVEQFPDKFSGGLATCGPIGDFKKQIDYYGDFRVLFDYFFPNVLPPSPMSIPTDLITGWDLTYKWLVLGALQANPTGAGQLINTSKAAINPDDVNTIGQTTLEVLWYNVFATNDAVTRLKGNPYGNGDRVYTGSLNDSALNQGVERIAADRSAVAHLNRYQTSGDLKIPLVTLHTSGDDVIPVWHELLYGAKTQMYNPGMFTPIIIPDRYGHCSFTGNEVLAAFGVLVWRVTGSQPPGLTEQFDPQQVQRDFAAAAPEVSVP